MTTAGFSPVRWVDFMRQVRRVRQPDANFSPDLAESRGGRMAPTGSIEGGREVPGTVLLDSSLLLMAGWVGFTPPRLQRVATTAAAIAELTSLVPRRGEYIGMVRSTYVARVIRALPVLSMTAEAAISIEADGGRDRAGAYLEMAEAVARSVGWPLYGAPGPG